MNKIKQDFSILIVDDDKTNRRILKELVEDEAKVLLAKNGTQAIEKAVEFVPDLIILDIVMPDMDGFAVIESLKKKRETQHIPIIFITGNTSIEAEERGLRLGAVDYISKPFHAGIVQARVHTQLQFSAHRKMLDELAHYDALTGIPNRRYFDNVVASEWRNCLQTEQAITIAVIDVDFFKNFNDTYGHLAGDKTLRAVAQALKSQMVRDRDFVARLGGEEFVVVLADSDPRRAEDVLHNCINAVRELDIAHAASECESCVTISIGCYTDFPDKNSNPLEALDMADKCLYFAKDSGRNQIHSQHSNLEHSANLHIV
ncbi:response regulator receiver modulated diguanylate cyclase [Catenovulum agarivorans DS-2]|uniref:diguanylate cyclase n=1 Tax=Catenovulum agarivorans DS-2 TaxID=1328313 RepID=W7QWX7_9ALTE|nr:diguanylate cyclase [Catenovulum agarivorans]EWH12243.1 response regulator receiver modulated diguanylate cyclase [Catenovulum agarivorans DS-2]